MHSAYGTRLLTIGEIFDRAVHLTIANLLPLAAIVGLVAVPIRAIFDWLDRADSNRFFGILGKMAADPRTIGNFFTLIADPHAKMNWSVVLWLLASLFPLSLAIAAASIASEKFLKGEKTSLGAVYLSAIRRLAPVIGANVLVWATYIAAFVAVIIVALVLWILWIVILTIGGGKFTSSQVFVLFALMVPSLVAVAACLTPLANCLFTGASLYGVRPFRSLREAWTMTLSRGLRGRSLAFGAAYFAFTIVVEIINTAVCGVLANVTHSSWPSFVARDVISLLVLIFGMALAVVFYLDARNRVGLIQEALAERENSQAQ